MTHDTSYLRIGQAYWAQVGSRRVPLVFNGHVDGNPQFRLLDNDHEDWNALLGHNEVTIDPREIYEGPRPVQRPERLD